MTGQTRWLYGDREQMVISALQQGVWVPITVPTGPGRDSRATDHARLSHGADSARQGGHFTIDEPLGLLGVAGRGAGAGEWLVVRPAVADRADRLL